MKYLVSSGESFSRGLPLSHVKSAKANGSGFEARGRADIRRVSPLRFDGRADLALASVAAARARACAASDTPTSRSPKVRPGNARCSSVVVREDGGRAARRCAERDAESSARLSSSTFTRGSPKKPNWRPSVCAVDERPHREPSRPAARRATRATWRTAFAGEMSGSSPDADDVTMSDGIFPFTAVIVRDHAVHGLRDQRVGELRAPSDPCSCRSTTCRPRTRCPPPTGADGNSTAARTTGRSARSRRPGR